MNLLALFYADPGSGALLWQSLVAICLGGLYYFRGLLARFFGTKSDGKDKL